MPFSAFPARDFARSNLSAFVRSSPCTMPNIGGGVERTSTELRLRRPGRRLPFLEYSRRCWHGYSWGGSAYLRAAPPHTCILVLSSKHTTVSCLPSLFIFLRVMGDVTVSSASLRDLSTATATSFDYRLRCYGKRSTTHVDAVRAA